MNTLLSDSLETEPIKIYIYTFFIKKYKKKQASKRKKKCQDRLRVFLGGWIPMQILGSGSHENKKTVKNLIMPTIT